jgi:hypothetical protein
MLKTGVVNVDWSKICTVLWVMENWEVMDVNFTVELATKAQRGVEV